MIMLVMGLCHCFEFEILTRYRNPCINFVLIAVVTVMLFFSRK